MANPSSKKSVKRDQRVNKAKLAKTAAATASTVPDLQAIVVLLADAIVDLQAELQRLRRRASRGMPPSGGAL